MNFKRVKQCPKRTSAPAEGSRLSTALADILSTIVVRYLWGVQLAHSNVSEG